jgi:hypothetical protein
VHRGDQVAEGAAVGAVGTSGRRSAEQPHLHFGVREAGQRSAYRDPLDFLSAPPIADRPGPAPAPVPVGAPAAADPSPAPAAPSPAPTPAHAPMPSPTRGPVPEPEHIPALPLGPPIPALLPSRALAGGADPHGAPYGRHAPDLGSLPQILAPSVGPHPRTGTDPHEPARAQHGAAAGRATASTGPGGAPSAPHAPGPAAATPAHRAGAKKHGINLGWLAACIGLIALATVLGHPPGSRRADVRRRRPAGGRPLPPDKTTAASKTSRACSAARHRPTLAAILRPAQRGGSTR